jgi:hypothetical protein
MAAIEASAREFVGSLENALELLLRHVIVLLVVRRFCAGDPLSEVRRSKEQLSILIGRVKPDRFLEVLHGVSIMIVAVRLNTLVHLIARL